jgi:predicted metal-binding membrane protein
MAAAMRTHNTDIGRALVWPIVFCLSGLLALEVWSRSSVALSLRVEGFSHNWPHHILFVIDWALMCFAMMFPSALPLLAAIRKVAKSERVAIYAVIFCALGFLLVWVLAGITLRVIGTMLAGSNLEVGTLWNGGGLIAGSIYLASPFALKCAEACRSPLSFIAIRWGRPKTNAIGQAARIGLAYGRSCFGCCWPLMLVMSLIVVSSVALMLFMTLLMLAVKQVPELLKVCAAAMGLIGIGVLSGVLGLEFGGAVLSGARNLCGG